jgi:hypothetical protein
MGRGAEPVRRSASLAAAFGCLTALIALLAFSAPAKAADPVYGVVPQDGALPTQDDLKLMSDGGITSVRTILTWAVVESVPGQYDWSGFDEIVRQTTANGIATFPFLYGTPAWATAMDHTKCDPSLCVVYPPKSAATREAFAKFAAAAAARYGPGGAFWTVPVDQSKQLVQIPCDPIPLPGCTPTEPPPPPPPPPGDPTPTPTPIPPTPTPAPLDPALPPCQCTVAHPITTWQIWNEQNSPKYFAPKVNVNSYAKLLKGAGDAIHKAQPGAEVILGGMWGPDSAKKVVTPVSKYLAALYKTKGIKDSFDSIALHPYASSAKGAEQALDVAHKVVKKAHDRNVGTWITEIGWAAGGPKSNPYVKGKAGQASILKQALKGFKSREKRDNLRGVFWYSWRDKPGGDQICEWCGYAGLRAKNGTAKPSWKAFLKIIRS